jgi:hypothetical protein
LEDLSGNEQYSAIAILAADAHGSSSFPRVADWVVTLGTIQFRRRRAASGEQNLSIR